MGFRLYSSPQIPSRSRACLKDTPSISSMNRITSPPAPQPKQWKRPFSSLTVRDGVFSEWKGHKPLYSLPVLRRETYCPTTETIDALFIRSRILLFPLQFVNDEKPAVNHLRRTNDLAAEAEGRERH